MSVLFSKKYDLFENFIKNKLFLYKLTIHSTNAISLQISFFSL